MHRNSGSKYMVTLLAVLLGIAIGAATSLLAEGSRAQSEELVTAVAFHSARSALLVVTNKGSVYQVYFDMRPMNVGRLGNVFNP